MGEVSEYSRQPAIDPGETAEEARQFPNGMASSSVFSMELLRNAACIKQLVSSVPMLLCFKVPTSSTGYGDESCAL